jgi:hypothetical protein
MDRSVTEQIVQLQKQAGGLITRSWSANFEEEPYPDRPEWILTDSLLAISATHVVDDTHATFVNLVTPGNLGNPETYLVPALEKALGDKLEVESIGQCGCGGYVLRARRLG